MLTKITGIRNAIVCINNFFFVDVSTLLKQNKTKISQLNEKKNRIC